MSHNVLLIEDDDADALLVQRMLRNTHEEALSVRRVSLLADAMCVLHADAFDVVLVDLSLPDCCGLDAIVELRAAHPTLPIVVLSGCEDDRIPNQVVQIGAQNFLVKQCGNDELVAQAIRRALACRPAEGELACLAETDLAKRTLP